jgi:1-acyl-sn-glycerol-3-phosphate acyltransferase
MSAREPRGQDLPRTDAVPHPPRHLLHNPALRAGARRLLARKYDVRVTGGEHVPRRGPFIVAANHIGWLDGPLMAIVLPRPVHAWTKAEMFTGRTGVFLRRSGQIPLDRFHADPAAVKSALRVLRAGNAVGVFPEGNRGDGELRRFHRGAAYLALATGAPVVPVAFLGTRLPGAALDSRPPAGSRLEIVVGRPVPVDRRPWPRTREHVEGVSRLLQGELRRHLDDARALTGLELPGPVPAHEREPDPATALTDEPRPPRTKEHHD